MTKQIKEILSWYAGDSPGILTNLARMLNHGMLAGTGKMVILPVDQGFEHGPGRSFAMNPPAYNPHYHFELAIESGCNAYAAPLGFLEAGAAVKAKGPEVIDFKVKELLEAPTRLVTMKQAAKAVARPDAARDVLAHVLEHENPSGR